MNTNRMLYVIAREIRNAIHNNMPIDYLNGLVTSLEFIPTRCLVHQINDLKAEIRIITSRETGIVRDQAIRDYLNGFATSIILTREENVPNINRELNEINNNFMQN